MLYVNVVMLLWLLDVQQCEGCSVVKLSAKSLLSSLSTLAAGAYRYSGCPQTTQSR